MQCIYIIYLSYIYINKETLLSLRTIAVSFSFNIQSWNAICPLNELVMEKNEGEERREKRKVIRQAHIYTSRSRILQWDCRAYHMMRACRGIYVSTNAKVHLGNGCHHCCWFFFCQNFISSLIIRSRRLSWSKCISLCHFPNAYKLMAPRRLCCKSISNVVKLSIQDTSTLRL